MLTLARRNNRSPMTNEGNATTRITDDQDGAENSRTIETGEDIPRIVEASGVERELESTAMAGHLRNRPKVSIFIPILV